MEPQDSSTTSYAGHQIAVLDTNAVLALFWFHDERLKRLSSALEAGQLRWVATQAMREELAHVLARLESGKTTALGRRPLRHDPPTGPALVLEAYDRLCAISPAPHTALTPRCTDPDDQKFIDLALDSGAQWLLTRDRALLKLRRKLQALRGCKTLRPEDWG